MSKKDFQFTTLNQLARMALGPLILVLLPFFLSMEQQGFWFAMTSITAIMAFADMGLCTAVMQCSAHEYANLCKAQSKAPDEVQYHQTRIDTLLTYSIRRVGIILVLAIPSVLAVGFYILSAQNDHATQWATPWVLFCLASSASLLLTVILAYYEGWNDVARIQRVRALVALTNALLIAVGLVLGLELWTLPLATGLSTVLGFCFVWKQCRNHLVFWRSTHTDLLKTWSREVSPLLSKYAMSWVGGYLMFQLFTPIVFRMEGSVAAGRVGLTISIFTAIFAISNIWSTYQMPRFSIAIALRDRRGLEKCLSTALKGSLLTYAVLMTLVITLFLALQWHPKVVTRLLGIDAVIMLALAWLLQLIIHNLAVYVRAFKEDPLAWQTLVAAAYTVVSTLICIHYRQVEYLFLGFLSVYLWFLPVVFRLFNRKRHETLKWPPEDHHVDIPKRLTPITHE